MTIHICNIAPYSILNSKISFKLKKTAFCQNSYLKMQDAAGDWEEGGGVQAAPLHELPAGQAAGTTCLTANTGSTTTPIHRMVAGA